MFFNLMKKEDYSAEDNVELVKQDQLSLSTNNLDITIVDSSPKNVDVIPIEKKKNKTIAEICFEIMIVFFLFAIFMIILGYVSMGIMFAISYFKNDFTFFITNNCISAFSPCFFIGAFVVLFGFMIISSLCWTCRSHLDL